MSRRGFTLLEVLVATLIMALAVVGLLSSISTSLRNASRITEYDRAALLGRTKLDELLVDPHVPIEGSIDGLFDSGKGAENAAGWHALLHVAEAPPGAGPGAVVLQAIDLEVWWMEGGKRRQMEIRGYRPNRLPMAATS